MKIRLEKLAVNILKLTCGKNEKPRRGGLYMKNFGKIFILFTRSIERDN